MRISRHVTERVCGRSQSLLAVHRSLRTWGGLVETNTESDQLHTSKISRGTTFVIIRSSNADSVKPSKLGLVEAKRGQDQLLGFLTRVIRKLSADCPNKACGIDPAFR